MESQNKKINRILFFLILIIGGCLRLYGLGEYPGGLHVDEAYAGYEAYSLINYGVDSWGYHNPIYFISWGSGMNVLETYLMIPFVKILGLTPLAIRLPQALLSIVALVVVYLILKKVKNERLGLIGMFLMAICPWHYMLSRWGLESNLCLVMILLGSLFFIYGTEGFVGLSDRSRSAYLIPSAIFFGLDLYCYAATWIHVATIIVIWSLQVVIKVRGNNKSKENGGYKKSEIINVIIAFLILFIMAVPLFLFILVNIGLIPEIRSFISIPKMIVFRGDEVFNFSLLFTRIHDLAYILICQNDTQMWNAYLPYGMFYIFSLPIILIGVYRAFVLTINNIKNKTFSYSLMLILYTIFATLFVIVQGVSIIRSNYLQLSLIFYWAVGLDFLYDFIKAIAGKVIVGAYVICFILFIHSYFTDFQERISDRQCAGSKEAIEAALKLKNDNYTAISITRELRHSIVLFDTKMPVEDYMDSVTWLNYPDKYIHAKSFGPFVWEDYYEEGLREDRIYIIENKEYDYFIQNGYELTKYGHVWLAVK